jgi:drug/metabolite transporter (DMT)-like permease
MQRHYDETIVLTTGKKTIEPKSSHNSSKVGLSIPREVWFGLGLAILLDTGVQLCWKSAVLHVPESATWIETAVLTLRQPLFYVAIAMFLAQFVNWMRVLSKADLSFAQPITSLSYISVCSLSVLWLHEVVPPGRLLGMALILAGVWFVSQTEHNTLSENNKI